MSAIQRGATTVATRSISMTIPSLGRVKTNIGQIFKQTALPLGWRDAHAVAYVNAKDRLI